MTIAVSAFQPTGGLKIVYVLSVLQENFSKPTLLGFVSLTINLSNIFKRIIIKNC